MSDPAGGITGRFLRVDLTERRVTVEETPDVARWLGPRGWNALIGWNETAPGMDAFDPGNPLVFSVGPLVGTSTPTAGRMTVSTIAPPGYPTPMWASASVGGYVGAELKYAGYDGVVFQGQSDAPVYLLIEDDKVTLKDASDLWGQGVFDTQQALKARHSRQHQVLTIGPAGEQRVRFATIAHRLNNVVGNAGFGGVMGSKRLKAVVVRGTGGVGVADPQRFLAIVAEVWELGKGGVGCIGQIDRGYPLVACSQGCSVRCGTHMSRGEDRYGAGTKVDIGTCNDSHWRGGTGQGRAYRGRHVDGTELNLPPAPGFGDAGTDLGNLIETLGMTTWVLASWGRYFAALRELGIREFRVIGGPDDGQIERIDIDSAEWWREWMNKTAHRRGVGDDYAEGFARFYEKYELGPRRLAELIEDKGSRGHGWHREGRLMEPHPSPYWEYSALLYAVSTRDVTPSTHGFFFLNGMYGYPSAPKDPSEIPARLLELAERLYGSAEAVHPGDAWIEHVTAWHQHRAIIKDSMGVCDWVFPLTRRTFDTREAFEAEMGAEEGSVYGDVEAEAKLFSACTGVEMSIDEMEAQAARIVQLERCIEVRNNGRDRTLDEAVIPHYQWSEKTDGTHLSADAAEFHALLDRYYDLRGWDRERGWPTRETLDALGLDDVAAALEPLRQPSAEGAR
jgi:aldehyde:ferredoxin oxidoreductase